jgi:pimeloyl-ACP methyl ester carboxylesterase
MAVIFVHGAGGSRLSWQLQLHHFEGSLGIELPGHPNGRGFKTIQQYSAWVREYLQENQVKDPVIVGHSMGGAIAIECALQEPSLKGLVLVGTGARLRVREDIFTQILQNYPEASMSIARMSVSANCDPVVVERIAREMLKVSPEVTHGDYLACNSFDRMADVERIATPTLVICGEEDQLTPLKYSEYLHKKISKSKLVVIPGAGHSVMLEKYREFNESLEAFLNSL